MLINTNSKISSGWFNIGDTKGREEIKKKVKQLNLLDRAYRVEVQDPTLRLKKLKDLWQHADFFTSWASQATVTQQLKEILNYQIMQIYFLIEAEKGTSREPGIEAQQLAVLNKIFEIVSILLRSANGEILAAEDHAIRLEKEWEEKEKEYLK